MEIDEATGMALYGPGEDPGSIGKTASNQTESDKTKPEHFSGKPKARRNVADYFNRKYVMYAIMGIFLVGVSVVYISSYSKGDKKKAEKEVAYGAERPEFVSSKKSETGYNEEGEGEFSASSFDDGVYASQNENATNASFQRPTQPQTYPSTTAVASARTQPQVSGNYSSSSTVSSSKASTQEKERGPMQVVVPGLVIKGAGAGYSNNSYASNSGNSFSSLPSNSSITQLLTSTPAGASSGMPSSYQAQNNQSDKVNFFSSNRDSPSYGDYLGDDTLWLGTIIPAVLKGGLNTDLPGEVEAYVTENVYDSKTGRVLLIPQGSRLFATYNSNVSYAQSRVQIAWNTLTRPDGFQLNLGNMNGVDAKGYSGYTGKIDEHYLKWFQAAIVVSAFTALNTELSYSASQINNQTIQNVADANQSAINQLGVGIMSRALDIQPTINIKPGRQINIMVNKNLALPPLERYEVTEKYIRK